METPPIPDGAHGVTRPTLPSPPALPKHHAPPVMAPRTPASTLTPKTPDGAHGVTRPTLAQTPAGWWAVNSAHPGNRGNKADVVAAITADATIPAHWKTALLAEIAAMNAQAVEVHAHGQAMTPGGLVLSLQIKKLF